MSDASSKAPDSTAGTAAEGLFARQATGLVREVSPLSSLVFNLINGSPIIALSFGLFFALSVYPGGNFFLAILLIVPIALSILFSFGLLTQAIPRSGGDYVLVSRILGPAWGLMSSFCMTLAGLLSNAFFGVVFATLAVGPGLVGVGLLAGNESLVNAGNEIGTQKGLIFLIGAVCIILGGAVHLAGPRRMVKIQNWVFGIATGGLLFSLLLALFTSPHGFSDSFNEFASSDLVGHLSYDGVIANAGKEGVVTDAPFSFANTIPLIGVLAGFSIYAYWSANMGGELRRARSSATARSMAGAGLLNLLFVAIGAAILLHGFGKPFLTALYGGGAPSLSGPASYFFFTGVQLNSWVVGAILALTFIIYWPLATYISMTQPARMLFAYSFDGILPKSVAKVSTKYHAPYVAVIIATAMSVLVLAWAVFIAESDLFRIIVYATLIQLISMALVGASALLLPWLRPEIHRAALGTGRVLGLPVVTWAGAGSVLSCAFLYFLYFHYEALGLQQSGQFFIWAGGTLVAALIFYVAVRAVRRSQGVDLKQVYAEIPPE